jgi:RHS repeat-associated protein
MVGGQVVTLTGTGYDPSNISVTIGGVSATVLSATTTTVNFKTPSHALPGVTVAVQISTTSGSSNTVNYTYTTALPTITSITPTGGLAGTSVIITGTNLFAATGSQVTFGGATATYNVVSTTQITATAPTAPAGPVLVHIVMNNGNGNSSTSTADQFTYTNHPPTVTNPGNQTNNEGDSVSLQVAATDPEGDPITYSASGLPAGLSIGSATGKITGTVLSSDAQTSGGTYSVTVTATDDHSASASQTFTWSVHDITTPTFGSAPPTQSGNVGIPVSALQVTATDADSDSLTYSATGLPGGLSIDGTTGVISGTPASGSGGSHSVTVTASDGQLSGSVSFTWNIGQVALSSISPSVGPMGGGQTITLAGTGFDPAGTTVSSAYFQVVSVTSTTVQLLSLAVSQPWPASTPISLSVSTSQGTSNALTYTFVKDAPTVVAVSPTTGSSGTTVTITGTNFFATTLAQVKFGGVAATSFSIDSTTQITAQAPAATHTVDVQVNNGNTWSATSSLDQFTYPNQAPAFNSSPSARTSNEADTIAGVDVSATDPDGDSIAYIASGLPAGVSINTAGVITGIIGNSAAQTAAGSYTVLITATDSYGASATESFAWTVNDATTPAVTAPSDQHSAEGDHVSGLSIVATDGDSDPLTYAASGLPAGLSIDSSTGVISGTISYSAAETPGGSYTVTLTASDGRLTGAATFGWTVADTNRPPAFKAPPAQQNSNEGAAVTGPDVSATDPDGDAVSYSASGLPTGLSINASGVITGTVSNSAGQTSGGSYSVLITATDSHGAWSQEAFGWTINDTTTPTVTAPADQHGAEGDTVTGLAVVAADGDSDPLTYAATGLPTGLSIDSSTGLISGTISYSAAETSGGNYTVTVTASDGRLTGSASFAWTVADTNRPPVFNSAAPGAQTNNEGDTVANLDVSVTDPDADPITYSASGLPAGLSINSTGVISGTIGSSAGQTSGGGYTVIVTAADSHGATATESFVWTVNDVTAPSITLSDRTSAEESSVSSQLSASDADSDPLTYTATGLPPGLAISAGGLVSGTVATGSTGTYAVTVTVSDGRLSGSTSFTWTINPAAPVLSALSPGVGPMSGGQTITLTGTHFDPSGTSVSFSDGNHTWWASIVSVTATTIVARSPALNLGGVNPDSSYPVQVAVDTAWGLSQSLTYDYVDDAPQITSISPAIGPAGTIVTIRGQSFFTSVGSRVLFGSASASFTIVSDTQIIAVAPPPPSGPRTIDVTVSNGNGFSNPSAADQFTYNQAPVFNASPSPQSDNESDTVSGVDVSATDPDGDSINYSATGLPAGLSINGSGIISGTIAGSAAQTAGGSYTVVITATDSYGASASESFTWTVNDVTRPTAVAQTYSVSHAAGLLSTLGNPAQGVLKGAADGDGDPLQALLVSQPAHGHVTLLADGTFSYTFTTSFVGIDTFTYQATDGRLTSAPATVTINVTDSPPTAQDVSVQVQPGSTVQGSLQIADSDDPSAVIAVLDSFPAHGTLSAFGPEGTFEYTPAEGFAGFDSFTYAARDAFVTSAPATVMILVTPAATQSLNLTEGEEFSGTLALFAGQFDQAQVNWGDGTTTDPVPVADGLDSVIDDLHSYQEEGTYTITITATNTATGHQATVTETATVSDAPVEVDAQNINSTTGELFSGTLGDLFDSRYFDLGVSASTPVESGMQAVIDWGDGQTSSGSFLPGDSADLYHIAGSHTYQTTGTYTVGITILDDGTPVASTTTTADVTNPVVSVTGAPFKTTLGSSFSGVVASVAWQSTYTTGSPAPDDHDTYPVGSFTAVITWGDGTTSTVSGGNGAATVSGTHQYASAGSYAVRVSVTDQYGDTGSDNFTAVVTDPNLAAGGTLNVQGLNASSTGLHFSGALAQFSPLVAGNISAGAFTATINWGDGTTSQGQVSGTNAFTVSGDHIYRAAGSYAIGVSVQGNGWQGSGTAGMVVSVPIALTPLQLSPVAGSGTFNFNGALATFTVPNALDSFPTDDHLVAFVEWGDGRVYQILVGNGTSGNGTFQVATAHGYDFAGTYTINILMVGTGVRATASTQLQVTSAVGSPRGQEAWGTGFSMQTTTISGFRGQTIGGVLGTVIATQSAESTNMAGDQATINWGDGSSTTTTVASNGDISGNHAYQAAGTYAIGLTVADPVSSNPLTYSATAGATVFAPALTASNGQSQSAVSGQQLTSAILATFSQASSSTTAATGSVDWGDGTLTSGTVSGSGGQFQVTGSHVYAHPGNYTVNVNIQEGDAIGLATCAVAVSAPSSTPPAPLVVVGMAFVANEGRALDNVVVATFNDNANLPNDTCRCATITWGDGTSTQGTVESAGGNSFNVRGSHTYAEACNYAVQVKVQEAGFTATGGSTAVVSEASITATGKDATVAKEGDLESYYSNSWSTSIVVATFDDADADEAAGHFSAMIDWGTGKRTTGTIIGAEGHYIVMGVPPVGNLGTFTLTTTIWNSAGTSRVQTTGTLTVAIGAVTLPTAVMGAYFNGAQYGGYGATTTIFNWGDGSPAYPYPNGTEAESGQHSYDAVGTYTYTINQPNAGSGAFHGSTSFPISIVEPPLRTPYAIPSFQSAEGADTGSIELADFVDVDHTRQPSAFAATIYWGDGQISSGTISSTDGTISIWSGHTYTEEGTLPVLVLITDGSTTYALQTQANVSGPLSATSHDVSAFAGVSTGQVAVATVTDSDGTASDMSATIQWGDGSTSTGTIVAGSASGTFDVVGSHTYARAGSYTITVQASDEVSATTAVGNADVSTGSATAQQLTNDPLSGQTFDFADGSVALNTGGLRLQQQLDFDLSPGTSVGGDPALVYNSATVNVRPIIQTALDVGPENPAPTQIQVQLTWDAGNPQNWVTFTPGSQQNGTYVVGVQVDHALPRSGQYAWTLDIRAIFANQPMIQVELTGSARVVVRDNTDSALGVVDPYGPGWGIAGMDRLVLDCNGVLWEYGTGDSRFFSQNTDGTFTDPANDFGTLVRNADGSYTYTAKDQVTWNFNMQGRLTSVVDTHGLARSYSYDDQGRLAQVTTPDGGTTTLSYTSGLLSSIQEPGDAAARTFAIARATGTDITKISGPGGTRSFGYDGHDRITSDSWDPLAVAFRYDQTSGLLDRITLGDGTSGLSVYTIAAAAGVDLYTANPTTANADHDSASIVDPLGNETGYLLDSEGRMTERVSPDDAIETWQIDSHGQVSGYVDPRGLSTFYRYDYSASGKGDVLEVDYTDANLVTFDDITYQYDSTFHHVLVETENSTEVTRYQYNAQGDLTQTTDPMGYVTSGTWSNGLEMSTTDGRSNTTSFGYDNHRRLTSITAPFINPLTGALAVTTRGYDNNGNLSSVTDPLGFVQGTTYDGANRLVAETDQSGKQTLFEYDSYGDLFHEQDPLGILTVDHYDARGFLISHGEGISAERVTTYSEDADGNVTLTVDPRGEATQTTFDVDNRPVKDIAPAGDGQREFYDADGNVTETLDGLGRATQMFYDGGNRLTETVDSLGNVSRSLYDGFGNLTATVDGRGNRTQMLYDLDNRLTETVDALGNTSFTRYDQDGNVTASVDGRGAETDFAYDAGNRETLTTDPTGATTKTGYDADGRVVDTIDGRTIETDYHYDPNGRLIETDDSAQHHYYRSYDADGNVTQTTDSRLGVTGMSYDDAQRVTQTIDPTGAITSTRYDLDGNVTATVDANAKETDYAYDPDGRLTLSTDPMHGASDTFYDADGRVTATVDDLGRLSQTFYDADGRVRESIDALGNLTLSRYDQDGNRTATVDSRGNETDYAFDTDNRQTWIRDGDGLVTQTRYDQAGNVTATVDATGAETDYSYDLDSRLTSTQDPLHGTAVSRFDADGNVTATVNSDGKETDYSYDLDNRRTATQDADGNVTESLYDGEGNVTASRDANGIWTNYSYDLDGRLTQSTDVLLQSTREQYDADGRMTASFDGMGRETQYAYDLDGRLTLTTDSGGNTEARSYDADGNLTAVVDGRGKETDYVYDADGRQAVVTTPDQAVAWTLYDKDGNVTETVDGLGNRTLYSLDQDGRRTALTDANGAVTQYAYDNDSRLTQVTDSTHNKTQFGYDLDGRQTSMTDALQHTATRAYDPAGHLTSTTDRDGRQRIMTYDNAGRLTAQTWKSAGGQVVNNLSYAYDPAGRITSAGDNAGAYTLQYDTLGRLTSRQDPLGLTLGFSYNSDDQRVLMTDSQGGRQTTTFDSDGRPASRTFSTPYATLRIDVTYNADSQVAGLTRSSDTAGLQVIGTTAYAYDPVGRPTSVTHQDAAAHVIASYAAAYDAAGRVTSTTDNGQTMGFGYDPTGQLTSAGSAGFAYDANGNPAQSGDQVGPDNQLLSDGTWNYHYDAEGNLVSKVNIASGATWTYAYDLLNRITSAEEDDAGGHLIQRADFVYDVFGNRIDDKVTTPQGTTDTRASYDDQGNAIADLNAQNQITTRRLYLDGVDQLFARVGAAGDVAWYLTDQQGSVRDLADGTGAIRDHLDYSAFGATTNQTNPSFGDRFEYTAREFDAVTGLQYSRARYYDPQTARWTSQDPLGLDAGDSNLYRYVANDPTTFTDPSGQQLVVQAGSQDAWLEKLAGMGISAMAVQLPAAHFWSSARVGIATGDIGGVERMLQALPDGPDSEWQRSVLKALDVGTSFNVQGDSAFTIAPTTLDDGESGALQRQQFSLVDGSKYTAPPAEQSALVTYATAAATGLRHGAQIVDNAIVQRIPLLNQTEAATQLKADTQRLIDENGGLYRASAVAADIAAESLATAATSVVGGALVRGASGVAGAAVNSVLPSGAACVANTTAKAIGVGAQVYFTAEQAATFSTRVGDAWDAYERGDPEAMVRALASAGIEGAGLAHSATELFSIAKQLGREGFLNFFNSCFSAGTPLLTPTGHKPIEEFQPGDLLLSRPEHDPAAALEAKKVEAVFRRSAPILHLHVQDRVIATTGEHPFYVRDKGWTSAAELKVGDLLSTHDCQWVPVKDLFATGQLATVFNLRVADYHTYFVGGPDWRFSVWAHNTCVYASTDPNTGNVNYVGITDNFTARAGAHWRAKGLRIAAVPGLGSLARADARAVEQVLIEQFALGKNGGSLLNKINAIATSNRTYSSAKANGTSILHSLGLFGF